MNKPKPAAFQVGYSNPNCAGQKPKYTPPPISADEIRRREEKEREREEQKRQREEKERKQKEEQKRIEKVRLEQWRKEYEENQKKDIIRKQQEDIARRNEEERLKNQRIMELQKRNDSEMLQRRDVYFQARLEAEMNKKKHIEAERKAANNIFGYVEPEPQVKQRPSTAASAKKSDVSGDLNNNQLNKQNYHFVNKAYNYNSPSNNPPVSSASKQPEERIPNSYFNEKPKQAEVKIPVKNEIRPSKPEIPVSNKQEVPLQNNEAPIYSRPEVVKSSRPEIPSKPRQDLTSAPTSSKPPSFEEFFPPAKKRENVKRAPVNPPKPNYKPSPIYKDNVSDVIYQPKKQLQNVYQNIIQSEPKQDKKPPKVDSKNHGELDEINALIEGATKFSFLEDSLKQQNFGDTDEYNDVYGLPEERDIEYEDYNVQSIGNEDFDIHHEEKQESFKKPNLKPAKRNSEADNYKKRAQWKKNNHSVLEPKSSEVEVPSALQKKVSQQNNKDNDRNNLKNFMKQQHKRGNSNFEIVVKTKEGDKYSYDAKAENVRDSPDFKQEEDSLEQEKQSSKRVKKEWNKNKNAVIMPVEDTSPQRKQWNNQAQKPDFEEEKFEVVNIEQNEEEIIDTVIDQPEIIDDQEDSLSIEETKIKEKYDNDQKQYERMIKEMQDNLFLSIEEDNDISTQDESCIDDDKKFGSPTFSNLKSSEPKVVELPDDKNDQNDDKDDRDDFDYNEAEEAKKYAVKETDHIIEAQMKNLTFGGGIDKMMNNENNKIVGEKIDEDLTRYNTIERVRDYLEQEIGEEILSKAHPILKEFGDDILYENNIPLVIRKLEGILSRDEVMQYLHFFATLIFFEMEAERIARKRMESAMEAKPKQEKINIQSFRDINMNESKPENVFKNVPNQSLSYFTTAKFGAKPQ